MLEVENITKTYGDKVAVNGLSFSVSKGKTFGILGTNGAGKTTTFKLILQLISPDSGAIKYEGKKIGDAVLNKIGFLPEERSLYENISVEEQISFFAKLKGMSDPSKIDKALDYWLERLEISEYKKKKPKELSKGNQQKIAVIIALIHDPEIVILDEMFSGLDPANVEIVKNIIFEIQKNKIIIFSSHRMEQVDTFCDDVVILNNGKTVLQGKISEVKKAYGASNVYVEGDFPIEELLGQPHSREGAGYRVHISSEMQAKALLNKLSQKYFVRKYALDYPTLNEIFLEKTKAHHEETRTTESAFQLQSESDKDVDSHE